MALGLICSGVFHVRPAAQVDEGVVFVSGDIRLLLQRVAVFVQAAFFQAVDQLQLVGLVVEDVAGFVGGNFLAYEGAGAR